jgi:hypothetical protein
MQAITQYLVKRS